MQFCVALYDRRTGMRAAKRPRTQALVPSYGGPFRGPQTCVGAPIFLIFEPVPILINTVGGHFKGEKHVFLERGSVIE